MKMTTKLSVMPEENELDGRPTAINVQTQQQYVPSIKERPGGKRCTAQ